jgi:hypothetical protein
MAGFIACYLILLIFIVIAIYNRRKELGYLDMREGLRTGLGVALVAAMIYGVALFAYYTWVDHAFVNSYGEAYRKQLTSSGSQSPEEIIDKVNSMKAKVPFLQATSTGLSMTIFIGGIFTLLTSLVLRKKP